jgi:hypothetical protein
MAGFPRESFAVTLCSTLSKAQPVTVRSEARKRGRGSLRSGLMLDGIGQQQGIQHCTNKDRSM